MGIAVGFQHLPLDPSIDFIPIIIINPSRVAPSALASWKSIRIAYNNRFGVTFGWMAVIATPFIISMEQQDPFHNINLLHEGDNGNDNDSDDDTADAAAAAAWARNWCQSFWVYHHQQQVKRNETGHGQVRGYYYYYDTAAVGAACTAAWQMRDTHRYRRDEGMDRDKKKEE